MDNATQTELNKQAIKDILEDVKDLQNRVMKIEASSQKTDFQYDQIMESLKTLNEKTIPNLMQEINALKNKPIKRYDQIVTGLIGGIVGALGGYIASLFLK